MAERHFWDTCCWIDFVAEGGDPKKPMTALWHSVATKTVELVISPVILAETLLQVPGSPRPWPDPHDADAMFDAPGVTLAQLDRRVGERARSLRRKLNLKTPDALHLACCIENNIDAFITRDASDLLKLTPVNRKDGERLWIAPPTAVLMGPLFAPSPK